MDVRYRILNKSEKTIFCNLENNEQDLIVYLNSTSQKLSNDSLRGGVSQNDNYIVYAFSSQKDYVKSSQKFKTQLSLILNSTSYIFEIIKLSNLALNANTNRLIHNLTTLNAHSIQEIYSLIPQEIVSRRINDQISCVQEIVNIEQKETAITLLKIAKINTAMKVEFSVFKKLFESNPNLQIKNHNVHKVLMNMFYHFFSDFTDKNVKVIVGDNESTYTAFFDYESLQVALYHIIDNATKYIRPRTIFEVKINNDGDFLNIIFDMISIVISESEKNRIFEDGFSGEFANKLCKAGNGIGMSMAKNIIELNFGSISVEPHPETIENFLGTKFQRNVFTIKLPRRN